MLLSCSVLIDRSDLSLQHKRITLFYKIGRMHCFGGAQFSKLGRMRCFGGAHCSDLVACIVVAVHVF